MTVEPERLSRNLTRVRSRMQTACERASRSVDAVTLVAVTKTVGLEEARTLATLGVADLGENRVQELVRKTSSLAELPVRWHMIGHLQRNKVKKLLPSSTIVHSLESSDLADVLSRRAAALGIEVDVLIEVNVSGEEQKYGVAPEEAATLAEKVAALPALKLRGLMTMAPFLGAGGPETAEELRPLFAGLRELARTLARNLPEGAMSELSMGMTQDFEVAIEEGATMVRIGSALFA